MDGNKSLRSCSWNQELDAIILALIGGFRYGVKIRLPHALVMTLLFRRDLSLRGKVRSILQGSAQHATHLGAFAFVYKSILLALKVASRSLNRYQWRGSLAALLGLVGSPVGQPAELRRIPKAPGYPDRPHHALLAGAIGGYLIWGRPSSINNQIVLYLSSRVLVALWKRILQKVRQNDHSHPRFFALVAAVIWGAVMFMFEDSPQFLHPSLKSSMDEIYRVQAQQPSSGEKLGS